MDMSFATQALATEYCVQQRGKLAIKVHEVPREIEEFVSITKLDSMGIKIDSMTSEQVDYVNEWQHGT
jgi:adenosylhomocysteinase